MIIKNRGKKQFLDRKKDDMEGNNVLFELKSTDFKLNQLKATKKSCIWEEHVILNFFFFNYF